MTCGWVSSSSIWPHRPALGEEDFLISGSNQAAADMVDRWPDWPHWAVVVVAPAGAGKTHLANVWRLRSAAARLEAAAAREADAARAQSAARSWSRTCTPASATSVSCSIS